MKHVGYLIEHPNERSELVPLNGRLTDADVKNGYAQTPIYIDDPVTYPGHSAPQTFEQVVAERDLLMNSNAALRLKIKRIWKISKSRLHRIRELENKLTETINAKSW